MIQRQSNIFFYQNIKWQKLAQYIGKLKSRKNEMLFKDFNFYLFQNYQVNFPLLVLSVCKHCVYDMDSNINNFELGYLLYSFSTVRYIDVSFYYYYRNSFNLQLIKSFQYLVFKVHYLLIFLSLQLYSNAIKCISNSHYYAFYNSIYKKFIELKNYEKVLLLDFRNIFNSLSLSIFLYKVFSNKDIVKCVLKFFDYSFLNEVSISPFIKNNYTLNYTSKLFKKLQEVVIFQLIYELSSLLDRFCHFQSVILKVILCENYREILLVYSATLKDKVISLLLINGFIQNKQTISRQDFLVKGIFAKSCFYLIDGRSNYFSFILKPSLYSQFLLMKNVSSIFYKFNTQPLFLINIRLNMLILLWLSQYTALINKTLYFLDYLIHLKLRCYYQNFSHFMIEIPRKKHNVSIFRREKNYFFVTVYGRAFYRSYLSIKLFWGIYLKYYTNLRGAV